MASKGASKGARKGASEGASEEARPKKEKPAFTVIKDTREQQGWFFDPDQETGCLGTTVQGLPTGDYSLAGYESVFTIERKASTGEFSQNVVQQRFENELKRLSVMPHPYVFLEFSAFDISVFPATSRIPKSRWKYLRITSDFLWKRFIEMSGDHNVPLVLVGDCGPHLAMVLFKWIHSSIDPKTGEFISHAKAAQFKSGALSRFIIQ